MDASPRGLTQPNRICRPTLSIRDEGIERLIANLPDGQPDDLNDLRSFARFLTREVSAWMIRKGQERQRNRLPERMAR